LGGGSSRIGNEAVRRKLVFLFVVVILLAAGAASTIKALALKVEVPSLRHVTISINELQHKIDTSTLPELEVSELY